MDELANEFFRRTFGKLPFFPRGGPVDEGAVLRDDAVEQVERWKNLHEVVEFSSCNEDQLPPGLLQVLQRLDRSVADAAVPGDSAVVVACQGVVSHEIKGNSGSDW